MATSVLPTTTQPTVPRPLPRPIDSAAPEPALGVGPLLVLPRQGRAYLDGPDLGLSPDEAALLYRLAQTPDRPVSRVALQAALPGLDRDADPRVVDVHLVRLMVKLGGDAVRVCHARDHDGFALVTRSESRRA